ncbi:hypothetical protein HCR_21420 [Hydrogenimonas cancrithermarum]|uniref:Uncharacterized protein n=1 Tax=Hydrogenimonas cancrithermarum TaxID=2993563 RepID=A0ABM8FPE2_9BACT|nr:hypothetical protein HCR_21420 [Hydrogenimonas cancrithermarum]
MCDSVKVVAFKPKKVGYPLKGYPFKGIVASKCMEKNQYAHQEIGRIGKTKFRIGDNEK